MTTSHLTPVFSHLNARAAANKLRTNAHVFPTQLKKLELFSHKRGPGQAGIRAFYRDIVPSLRYQNPQITFTSTVHPADSKDGPSCALHLENASTPTILPLETLNANEILTKIRQALSTP